MNVFYLNELYTAGLYRPPQMKGACSIESPNLVGSWKLERVHERCNCDLTELSKCMSYCDIDENCKGYVKQINANHCQIATTSHCPEGCSKNNNGETGILIPDGQFFSRIYDGCYIKETGTV